MVAAVRESVEEVQTQAVSDHDNHVGMCQQLQRSVDGLMQRDSGSDGGGVSRSQRADAKDENAAWRTDAIRRFWILTAERPAMFNLKHSELQAVLVEVTAVTDRVTNQLNTLTGFSVTDYMAEGVRVRVVVPAAAPWPLWWSWCRAIGVCPLAPPFPRTIAGSQSECYGMVMLFGRSETS